MRWAEGSEGQGRTFLGLVSDEDRLKLNPEKTSEIHVRQLNILQNFFAFHICEKNIKTILSHFLSNRRYRPSEIFLQIYYVLTEWRLNTDIRVLQFYKAICAI